jgi:hypothetical protein
MCTTFCRARVMHITSRMSVLSVSKLDFLTFLCYTSSIKLNKEARYEP